ncbi:MAG: hypothetical protein J6T01_03615 [Kiritimatiellae bacterium]|nr:hypothetical protein [Kiritimatiellia bacterium]
MKKLIGAALLAAFACGCVTNFRNDGGDDSLRPRIVRDAAYEKYEISDKPVTYTEQRVGIFPFYRFNWFTVGGTSKHLADDVDDKGYLQETIVLAKSGAYAAACDQAGCDSLVGTRYEVEYKWYFFWNEASVKVTGYPAKLTGIEFKPATLFCPCKQ